MFGLGDGTPLHQAAWSGQPDNAQCQIEAGAKLHAPNEDKASSAYFNRLMEDASGEVNTILQQAKS